MLDNEHAVTVFYLVETYIIFINTAIVSFYLWKQPVLVWTYVVAMIFIEGIVRILKPILRTPRPDTPADVVGDVHQYGMPSGHAIHVAFTLVYVWLLKFTWQVMYVLGLFGAIALYERYRQKYHTIHQLTVGGMIGATSAYGVVWILHAWLRRQLLIKTW